MKAIIFGVLNIAAVGGGMYGGKMLLSGKDPSTAAVHAEDSAEKAKKSDKDSKDKKSKGKDKDKKGKEGKDAKGGKEAKEETSVTTGYYALKFTRPFVIPVSDGWRTQSLVVMYLSIELKEKTGDGLSGLQEKVRDRVMQRLVSYSHEGGFSGSISDPDLYDRLRWEVKMAVEALFPEKTGEVLVLEVLKRDV